MAMWRITGWYMIFSWWNHSDVAFLWRNCSWFFGALFWTCRLLIFPSKVCRILLAFKTTTTWSITDIIVQFLQVLSFLPIWKTLLPCPWKLDYIISVAHSDYFGFQAMFPENSADWWTPHIEIFLESSEKMMSMLCHQSGATATQVVERCVYPLVI